jgi:hypothetical protein
LQPLAASTSGIIDAHPILVWPVGQAGVGPGRAASLIMRPSTGRTIVVLTNRLLPVLAVNVD